jgi:hypothetical protein
MRRRRFYERQAALSSADERWLELVEALPDGNSTNVMRAIDRMPAKLRALVYEFGLVPVAHFLGEGYGDLRPQLEAYRRQKQREWLATDYYATQRRKA